MFSPAAASKYRLVPDLTVRAFSNTNEHKLNIEVRSVFNLYTCYCVQNSILLSRAAFPHRSLQPRCARGPVQKKTRHNTASL